MLAALASESDDDDGGGSIVAPDATEQQVNLVRLQNGTYIPIHLWRRVMSFLTVREQAVSVRGVSRFFRKCSNVYMQNFWSELTIHLPQDAKSLARAMEMCQYLMRQEEYVEGTIVVVVLGSGVHELVGSCQVVGLFGTITCQKMLSIPCDNLSIVGKGEGETIVVGSFAVENGRKISIEGLTLKNSSGYGLFASGAGTEVVLKKMTVEECQYSGVCVYRGAQLVATGCQFHQNGWSGVGVNGSMTTARLTNCTSHHNKSDGVQVAAGAVVDLMGEGTSVHDNERYGLYAGKPGTTINVYQPCVLNNMSHGNKGENIFEISGGIVQQKDYKLLKD